MTVNQFDTEGFVDVTHQPGCPARYGVGDCDADCHPAEVWCGRCPEPTDEVIDGEPLCWEHAMLARAGNLTIWNAPVDDARDLLVRCTRCGSPLEGELAEVGEFEGQPGGVIHQPCMLPGEPIA